MNSSTLRGNDAVEHALNPSPGRSTMRAFTVREPKREPRPAPIAAKPYRRPVRAILAFDALTPKPKRRVVDPRSSLGSASGVITPGIVAPAPVRQGLVLGGRQMVAHLGRAGITVELSADRRHCWGVAEGGKIMPADLVMLDKGERLIVAWGTGTPPPDCEARASHPKDTDTTAVAVLAGSGVLACASCAMGGAS